MRLALALLLALALAPPAGAADAPAPPPSPSIAELAAALADRLGPPPDGRHDVALTVQARARPLAAPLETALASALAGRGYAVTPLAAGAEAEAAARAGGHDWLLRVQAGLVPGRRELAAVAEVVPAWSSFFLQRRPGARAIAPRLLEAHVAADAGTLLLGREGRPAGAPFAAVRTLARVPGRVLAIAIGELEPGAGPALAVATPGAVALLSRSGERLAEVAVDGTGARPVREPAAALAISDFGGGRLAHQEAGARGAVFALVSGRLEAVAPLDAAPLCAGGAGPLFGAFAPGTSLLEDRLAPRAGEGEPRSAARLYAVACAPAAGPVSYAALHADLRLELLGPDLRPPAAAPGPGAAGPAPAAVEGVGTGFTLADLDGDGAPEIVASSPEPGAAPADRIRVLATRPGTPAVLDSGPVAGAVLSGAAGDLTGDGVDDALLGAVVALDGGGEATDLLLVTSDLREAP
jgi:hypothetical protein